MSDKQEHQSSALQVRSGQEFWTEHQLAALKQLGITNAPSGDLAVFLHYAQRTGLDPFSRQLYMIERQGRWTMQAGIDALRIVAQRSGEYAGQVGPEWCGTDSVWRDVWLDDKPPAAARVGVLRRGFAQPLYAVAIFREYAGKKSGGGLTQMWETKGALMIAKCAEALALRKAFPMDLSGIYTAEEMAVADTVTAGPAPLAPTGQSERENVCSADTERVAELRTAVLLATELEQTTELLQSIWHDAKAAGALACTVSVPEGWRELATLEECTLSQLIIGARQAKDAGAPHGETVPVREPEPERCDAARKSDDARCELGMGHKGKHKYEQQPEPETLEGTVMCEYVSESGAWGCALADGHDGEHAPITEGASA
jgi:phage recombination protein Bet